MAPTRKYEKYGRFPWKLVIHLLLVVFTTCQVILIVNQGTIYAFSQYTLWNSLFLNHNIQGSTSPIVNSFMLFNTNHTAKYVRTSVHRYYYLSNFTISNYDYHHQSDGTKEPARLLVRYLDVHDSLQKGYQIEYNLYPNYHGPFATDAEANDFMNQVKEFRVEYNVIHRLNQYVDTSSACYDWKITQKYDYSGHGTIVASLDTDHKTCHSDSCNT